MESRRRTLRHSLTSAEAALWRMLKGRQLNGRKFRRQHSVGKYILDFYCVEEWLAIELDGESHRYRRVYDNQRTVYLNNAGIEVIRFTNSLVFDELEFVQRTIESFFGWKERQ